MVDVAFACARWLALALLALLPLIAWPGLSEPFSIPKLVALFATTWLLLLFAGLGRTARLLQGLPAPAPTPTSKPSRHRPNRPNSMSMAWLVFPWFASWIISTAAGDLSHGLNIAFAFVTAMFAFAVVIVELPPARMAIAMVIGATALAIVALAQVFGADPFALFGWAPPIEHGSPRLRVYGTLGNPNFVAALLTATTPLTVGLIVRARSQSQSRPSPWMPVAALILQLAGIIATGSRGGALGLLAAAITWATLTHRRHPDRRRTAIAIAAAGALVAVIAIIVSTARPLNQTIAGRAYIVGIAAPHAFDAPFTGRGPGAFEVLYPDWERDSRQSQRSRPPFAGPQQHAHNDYLEALIERGLLGLVTIFIIFATSLRNAWRLTRRTHDASVVVGAAAMLAALAAIACVDFPFARPTELTWLWSGVAMIILSVREASGDADGTLDDNPGMGSAGPDDGAGPRHDRRGDARGEDEVLGEA